MIYHGTEAQFAYFGGAPPIYYNPSPNPAGYARMGMADPSLAYQQPQAPAAPLTSIELLVKYTIDAKRGEVEKWVLSKGIAPNAQDLNSQVLALIGESDANLKSFIALHPDRELIQGLNKSVFFTKERLLFIGLLIVLFVALYFITKGGEND